MSFLFIKPQTLRGWPTLTTKSRDNEVLIDRQKKGTKVNSVPFFQKRLGLSYFFAGAAGAGAAGAGFASSFTSFFSAFFSTFFAFLAFFLTSFFSAAAAAGFASFAGAAFTSAAFASFAGAAFTAGAAGSFAAGACAKADVVKRNTNAMTNNTKRFIFYYLLLGFYFVLIESKPRTTMMTKTDT
jgi:hypothetical protein